MGDAEDFTIEFGTVCPHCRNTQASFEKVSETYFSGTEILCVQCAEQIDYWDSTLEFLAGQKHPAIKLMVLGARQTFFPIHVLPSQMLDVNLEDHTFIGYDLSAGYNNSLLSWGLKSTASSNRVAEPIGELYDLISRHYAPQLNGQGLFQTWEAASLCLRAMTALQDLSPNFFEGGNLREFRPVGLYRISAKD